MRRPCPARFVRSLVPVLLACLCILSGCSTFTHYPGQAEGILSNFEAGNFEKAYALTEKHAEGGLDQLVYLLEGGMILHTGGEPDRSNAVFEVAEEVIREDEEKAVLSLSQGTAQLGSLLVNEKTLPYQGEPFEKVFVNTYKALNYLLLGDPEGARVEIRRSFERQQENRNLYAKERERLEEEASRKGVDSDALLREVSSHYADQRDLVRSVANLYEDAFAYYLSALVYELNGEYNDAVVDLRKVQELRPGIPFVQNDLLRMSQRSGLMDLYREWKGAFGHPARFPDPETEGEILLFFENGMAPRKEQIKIVLPIPTVGMVSIAFPKYVPVPGRVDRASLHEQGGERYGETHTLTDVEAIAVRNLDDRMRTLVVKHVLRAVAKGAMTKAARDQGGIAAQLAANLYTVATEQADLRSWLTLPRNIQVARLTVPAGTREFLLTLEDGSGRSLQQHPFTLEVPPGGRRLVRVRTGSAGMISFQAID